MPFRLGYTLEFGQTQAEGAVLCAVFLRCNPADQQDIQGRKRFAVASGSLQQSRLDNPVAPRSGYAWALELRTGNPLLGSDSGLSFQKATADISLYRPVTRHITFASRVRGGLIAGGNGPPPPQERLYAGGAGSDRGFGENELGPLVYLIDQSNLTPTFLKGDSLGYVTALPQASAARTVPTGGNALVILQNELRIRDPFFPDLFEYVPFVDAGQLWTREQGTNKINLDRLIVTPGLGVRYFSPVGPIQANAGYNPAKPRPGPAYFAAINSPQAINSPLLCVTAAGASPVLLATDSSHRFTGKNPPECPGSFVPFRSSNFFRRFVFTVSIGASF
jgi:outer membrane protein insertion porin family/translocation and assembly module TamA